MSPSVCAYVSLFTRLPGLVPLLQKMWMRRLQVAGDPIHLLQKHTLTFQESTTQTLLVEQNESDNLPPVLLLWS